MTAPTAVEITGLTKNYGDFECIKGVDLTAQEGDVVSIIGSSGSGKSTLLRCINFLETPTSGSISIHGETISTKSTAAGLVPSDPKQLRRIRSRLAMVFQSFNLWAHKTVVENVMEAPVQVLKVPRNEAREKAEHLLQRVGMWDRRDHFPSQLSGGQKQRAAIARALAVDPEAMLFDEPTSALDPELVGEVLSVIRDLASEGRTMIMVTHEMAFARDVSSKVVFLHAGLIEEQGAPQQLFGSPKSTRLRDFLTNTTLG